MRARRSWSGREFSKKIESAGLLAIPIWSMQWGARGREMAKALWDQGAPKSGKGHRFR